MFSPFILNPIMQATAQPTTTWTILSLIEWGTQYLNERGFEDARLNIELLLSHILHFTRIHLYTNFDRPLSASELGEFKALLQRRLKHEPLQYILGETEFMGIPLYVSPSVLIPRPETEELVEKALEWIKRLDMPRIEVLDIGTGSGNIPIALERLSSRTYMTSIDTSADALMVAARNIARHGCSRIALKQLDIFGDVLPEEFFDVIISNPPYISGAEFALLQPEVRDFEPALATTDHADGYRFIRRICDVAVKNLRAGGVLIMEVAYNQGSEALRIAAGTGLAEVRIIADVAGNERMLWGRRAA
jgi:release factor glutamine methyltransferase